MSFLGLSSIHKPAATELVEGSVVSWVKDSLLEAGGFLNVSIPASGIGNSHHILHEVSLPGAATTRRVYQSARADWVWESGVPIATPPLKASGVYVNNSFVPFGTGCRPDWPNGRVTFPTSLPTGSVVTANYSARSVRVFTPRSAPWFYEVQPDSFDATQPHLSQKGSGLFDVLAQNRVQLPAIFVQCVPRVRRFEGYEFGSLARFHKQDVLFKVVAEDPNSRDRLHDALVGQWERTVDGVDSNAAAAANHLPIGSNGEVNPSGLSYSGLKATHPWRGIRVSDVSSDWQDGQDKARLFQATVRWTAEVILPTG